MISDQSYRKAFFAAIFFHLFLGVMLLVESTSSRPVLTPETKNEAGEIMPAELAENPKPDIIKATSVDNQEVMKAVNQLKQERANQLKAEQSRQIALTKQAEMARKERLLEQQRLQKLKDDEAKIAIAHKKQIEEEQKRLKQLALQKEQETKRLEELKKEQQELAKKQQEALKVAALKKKQLELDAKKAKEQVAKEELAKEQLAKAQAEEEAQAHAEQRAQEAAQRARLSGEVDKYKAMIVNAIGRRWILPDNVDSSLSSQFRIRLAPDGAVLEVSLTKSSGDPILDRSAQTAIYKASPLPVPTDPTTFDLFRDISLTVRPENVRG